MKRSSYCSHDLKMCIFYRGHARLIFTRVRTLNNFSAAGLVSATPPTVFKGFWWNFPVIVPMTWGWSGGAMVLGKLPVPRRPTVWITVGQGPTTLAVGAGGGCLDIFTLIYPSSPLSPSLWEMARYRLKYCRLKGPLNPKQPTNQPTSHDLKMCILYRGHAWPLFTRVMALCQF